MLKRNKVKHLNRNHSHRKAMINNMVTSLFEHERIESTLAKAKVVRSFAEKIITKAKKNLEASKPELLLHSKREVMRTIKDRDVVVKLFGDIAPRYKERNG
ncbi:MAG: 50S ribosomal protein L17, partial [Leptospira sp.]|nr:50S ribosomal protein L17 [Leptospira sp.]